MGGAFNPQILVEKLAKLNSSQPSIETLSHWCIFHMNKAKLVVETWDIQFHCAPREQRLAYLYLANDILRNSRRKGAEFVGEFWKVLPDALRDVMENGDEFGRNAAQRLVQLKPLMDQLAKVKDFPIPEFGTLHSWELRNAAGQANGGSNDPSKSSQGLGFGGIPMPFIGETKTGGGTLPITARTLETMIRLSTAHAKLMQRRELDQQKQKQKQQQRQRLCARVQRQQLRLAGLLKN